MKNKYNITVSLMYLCFTLLFLVKSIKISGAVWGEIIICTLFQYCIIALFIYSGRDRKARIKYILYGALVLIVIGFLFRTKVFEIINDLYDMFAQCIGNLQSALTTNTAVSFEKITLIIIVAVIALVTVFYLLVNFKLEMIASILLCGLMGYMYRFGYKKDVTSFTMAFVVMNLIIAALRNNARINTLADNSKKAVSIVIVILITSLITSAIPKNYSGIEKVTFSGITFGNEKKVIGYDDLSKKLGGSLELNSDVAFEYSYPAGVSDGITYFRGQTYDVYDGRNWTKSDFQKVVDSAEYKKKFSGIDKKYVDYVDIYPKNLKVKTFLAPERSYYVKKNDNSSGKIDEHNKVFDNGSKISDNYRVEFIDKSITKNLKEGNVNTIGDNDKENDEYRQLIKPYEDFMTEYDELTNAAVNQAQYLSVPKSMPDSLKKQIDDELNGYATNPDDRAVSDYEKVTQIYRYISSRCIYDLNASNLPKGKDFVDFFLNKDKKGYCMHFATACVMLCRMEGIPARLVTGFKETMTGKKPGEKYSITNNQAHAWCEVFMKDGIASNIDKHWITVDPTPDKDGMCEGIEPPKISSDSSDSIKNMETNEVTYSSKNYHSDKDFDENHSRVKQFLDEDSSTSSGADKKIDKKIVIPIVAILLLSVIRIIAISLKYRMLKKKESNIRNTAAMMKMLGFIGYKKKNTETELEFAERIDDYYLKKDVIKMMNLCNAEYYGSEKKNSEGYLLLLIIKKRIVDKIEFKFYVKQFFLF